MTSMMKFEVRSLYKSVQLALLAKEICYRISLGLQLLVMNTVTDIVLVYSSAV